MITVFNQIQIVEGHEWLTAFITQFRFYKMLVILFSLCNIPAIFQNYINYVLHNALNNYYTVYLDDIFVFLKTYAEYIKYINEII
jgi:hypothetical protein